MYTETDDFIRNVSRRDRSAFARSLANKTSGMSEGERRVLNIYCAEKIYCFFADGYMHGEMIRSYDVDEYISMKEYDDEYKQIDKDTESASVWSETPSDKSRRLYSNDALSSRRRGSDSNDSLSDDTSGSNGTGSAERIGGYNPSAEEFAELLRKVKEKFNLEDTEQDGENPTQSTRTVSQAITSTKTSISQIPALFKHKDVVFGDVNIDIGGGRFDLATNYLASKRMEALTMSNKKKTSQRNQEIINAIIEHRNRKKTDKVYREESEKVRKVLEENLLIIGNDSEN